MSGETTEKKLFDAQVESGLRKLVQLIKARLGNPAELKTDEKTSFVVALNELNTKIGAAKQAADAAAVINDEAAGAEATWSANKIQAAINAAIASLVNGADADADTLAELASKITSVAQATAGLLNLNEAQELTAEQKAQARATLGKTVLIVDDAPAATTAYSSEKVEALLQAKTQELVGNIGTAKTEAEQAANTLVESAKSELTEAIATAKREAIEAAKAEAPAPQTDKDFAAIVAEEWRA